MGESANVSSTVLSNAISPAEAGNDEEDYSKALEQRKARKKALRASRTGQPSDDIVPSHSQSPKKSKKRKHDAENSVSHPAEPTSTEEPAKKKHKNRTDFADPRDDTNLNDQSRKALEYAFTQMNRPSKWRFNKARQNWLIRNFWTPEVLPDIYLPLAVKYLANTKGGSREKLMQTCQSLLKVEEIVEKEDEQKTLSSSTGRKRPAVSPPLRSILKPTPGPLIGPSSSDEPPNAVNIISTSTTDPLVEIRRTRAQSLLDALNSSNT